MLLRLIPPSPWKDSWFFWIASKFGFGRDSGINGYGVAFEGVSEERILCNMSEYDDALDGVEGVGQVYR